jgi:hypothetical protein
MTLGVGGRGAGLGARSFSRSVIRIRSRTSVSGEDDLSTKRILSLGPRLGSRAMRRNWISSSLLGGGLTLLARWITRDVMRVGAGLGDLCRGRSTVSISLCLSTIWPGSTRLLSSRIKAGMRSFTRSRSRRISTSS